MPSIPSVPGPISAADLMANSNAITQAEQSRARAAANGGVLTDDKDSGKKPGSGGFDKDMFMQLMIAQLKYQNPLEPTDTNAMVQQASQMNMAEQMNNLASNFQAALKQSQMANATGMLGHQVTYTGPDGNPVTAWVTGVVFGKDPVITTSQDHKLTMDQIQSIGVVPKENGQPGNPNSPQAGAPAPGTPVPNTPQANTLQAGTPQAGTPQTGTPTPPTAGSPATPAPQAGTPETPGTVQTPATQPSPTAGTPAPAPSTPIP